MFFADRFPDVRFIYNTHNKGFGAANNQALSIASGDYILFLNPDTLIPEDCFEKCLLFLKSKNDCGALGVKMVDGTGRFLKESKRAFPDPLTSLYKLSGLTAVFPKSKIFARYYLGHLDENKSHEVDVLAGAFMMLPRKILDKVKGFDEDFFMYGEDIDLSYRIQEAGFTNYYFADTTIIHFKGESTKKGSFNYVKMFYKAMSVFVRKHYGSSKAGLYNFFIQVGIALRGALSALGRFLKWIGMPVIDLLTILFCFWLVKQFWVAYLLPYLAYDGRILLVTYPAFAFLFLITSYYSGLYDNGYLQARLNKSVLISTLVLFTIYALVPESSQFSRGVLLCSVALAYLMMTLMRLLLASLRIISRKKETKPGRIVIVGSRPEFDEVKKILVSANLEENILGRIALGDADEKSLSDWQGMPAVLKSGVVDELIYCQGDLSFKAIVESAKTLPAGVTCGFYASGANSIIGSSDKDLSGEIRASSEYYRLNNPLYRRVKRLFDAGVALIFLLTFPLILILKKRPLSLLKNSFEVLLAKKSFVGYALTDDELPPLKPSLLSPTGLPKNQNTLPEPALRRADHLYAKEYSVFTDLGLVYRGYKQLS